MKLLKILVVAFLLIISTGAFSITEGSLAPNFTVKSLNGKKIRLWNYRKYAVLVDFWATWCGPCKKALPYYNELYKKYRRKGFKVIAISIDDDRNALQKFLNKNKLNILIGHDPQKKIIEKYNLEELPSSVFIDKRGIIRHIFIGFKKNHKHELEKLLKKYAR